MVPATRSKMLLHIVLPTSRQRRTIAPEAEPLLVDKTRKILVDELYSHALMIGGGPEHVHILCGQSVSVAAEVRMNRVRVGSAGSARERLPDVARQRPDSARTVSGPEEEIERARIAGQKELCKTAPHRDEMRTLLEKGLIGYSEGGWN